MIVFTGRSESGVDDKMWAAMKDIAEHILVSKNVNEYECPIKLGDVIEVTRENIEELLKGWTVKFLGEDVQMSALLPMNEFSEATSILSRLEGGFLNQLLKGESPPLFRTYTLPSNSEIYLPRWLSKRLAVTWKFIDASRSPDTDTDETDLTYFRLGDIDIATVKDWSKLPELIADGCRKLLLERGIKEFYALIESGSDLCKNKRVRILNYKYFLFTCISTHCFNSQGIVQCTHDISCESRKSGEDEFVEFIERGWTNEKFIVIGDKPGMGKSQTLIRIASKLAALKTHFVIFLESNQVVENALAIPNELFNSF